MYMYVLILVNQEKIVGRNQALEIAECSFKLVFQYFDKLNDKIN